MGASVFFAGSNELATLTNTFSVAGVATDPTVTTLTVTDPTGAATPYTGAQLTHVGTGQFSKDITCNLAGTWQYLWEGTGSATDTADGTWDVQETALGRLYCTVESLKSRLGIPSTDTVDDFELHSACFAASRSLEQWCARTFWRTASTEVRTFEPHDFYCLKLPEFNDLVSVTTLKTSSSGNGTYDQTWSASDYQLLPFNPGAGPEMRPYTKVKALTRMFPMLYRVLVRTDNVQITGVFGWPAVPAAIRQASLILAAELFKLKDAPFGVTGFGDLGIIRIRENPKVAALAGPYQRTPMLVA